MAVAARFYISEMTTFAYDPNAAKMKLMCVVRGPENASWASATPSGTVEMHVTNPAAVKWFRERMEAKDDIALTFDVAGETADRVYG
jgi:hypothetical protein